MTRNTVLMIGSIVLGYMLGPPGDLHRVWRSGEKHGGWTSGIPSNCLMKIDATSDITQKGRS